MNRFLASALGSVALFSQAFGTLAVVPSAPTHERHHAPATAYGSHKKMSPAKTPEQVARECEGEIGKIKPLGTSLTPDIKADFDYHLKLAEVEVEALKDTNHPDPGNHTASCHRHLKAAHKLLKKHERQEAHKKKMEERKANAEERKAKALEKKARKNTANMAQDSHRDHGTSEGGDKSPPGSDVGMSASPAEKK